MKYQRGQQIATFLHDGEPFFLLRAQDVLSLGVIAYYQMLAAASAAPNAAEVGAVLVEFATWQREHEDLVKLPD